ncbi:hypothetical protein MHH60_14095 [Paenibacillus sp. FSL H7-0716]|uniref:Butirosin biosynthesis protein H N-terminal domain-containing protein n=1 Tax=Paenibacillus odorifer TaxID=189426 RepID=A0AB36JJT0_9BACL|nr:hypothetical protein [Paenibacillus odorifer]OME23556.1 hypothetical protein BSK47_03630 [Paenibacillus odorifer]
MFEIKASDLKKINGITCLEFCYGLILLYLDIPTYYLYYKSFYSVHFILSDLIKKGQSFISYDDVGRMHEIGDKLNILKLEYCERTVDEIEHMYNSLSIEIPIVVKIYSNSLSIYDSVEVPLGNHFVLLTQLTHVKVKFIDTFLEQEVVITREQFETCYSGKVFFMKMLYRPTEEQMNLNNLLKKFISDLDDQQVSFDYSSFLQECDELKNENQALNLRDAIGISRILLRRALDFFANQQTIHDPIIYRSLIPKLEVKLTLLNQVFLKIDYYRVKQNWRFKNLTDQLNQIMSLDIEIYKDLKGLI